MLFNSWTFLAFFLPFVVIVGLCVLRGMPRIAFLIGASFMFYGYAGWLHAAVLLIAILWVHVFVGRRDVEVSLSRTLWASALPIGVLFYFKYSIFFVRDLLHPLGMTFIPFPEIGDATLPAGVSFFTFQLLSYAVDRKRGLIAKPLNLPQFALLIGFFPHLIAGPILRYRDVARGLVRMPFWRLTLTGLPTPLTYICFGLVFKVLLADRLASIIAPLIKTLEVLSRLDAIFLVLAYSFQIYFDFYGYSLIAIGLGLLFGLTFPANFDRPYSSANPREFWRRWHITLSFWIRDYVYLPLGGNRQYVRNILITFALFGLWHGAGWNYVIWGFYNSALVIGYHYTRNTWDGMPHVVQVLITFCLISLGWLLFLFNLTDLVAFVGQLANPVPLSKGNIETVDWMMLVVAALTAYVVRAESFAEHACSSLGGSVAWGVGMAVAIFGVILFLDLSAVFIYFRF